MWRRSAPLQNWRLNNSLLQLNFGFELELIFQMFFGEFAQEKVQDLPVPLANLAELDPHSQDGGVTHLPFQAHVIVLDVQHQLQFGAGQNTWLRADEAPELGYISKNGFSSSLISSAFQNFG